MIRRKWKFALVMAAAIVVLAPGSASAMHIAEGILPAKWAGLWYVVAAPFLAWGLWDIKRRSEADPRYKAFVALVGAAVFIISCMPIPVPVAGSCSHPCGTGLAAILIGPGPAVVVTTIALALQALFMAHGGLSTLGANVVSMGVLGAFSGYAVWRIGRKIGLPVMVAAFAAGMIADWATYAGTSFELASALHADRSLWVLFATLLVAFMPTQIPLGLFEGALTAGAYSFVNARRPELLDHRLVKPATASKA